MQGSCYRMGMAVPEVLENEMARITIDRESHVVTMVRSHRPLEVTLLEGAIANFQLAVPLRERAQFVLLQDSRLAPFIRDEELDRALFAALPRLIGGFAARAILLATAVGRLQANRFASSFPEEARTFTDETEAMRYLLEKARSLREAR